MYMPTVAFYPLSKPLYPILILCCSVISECYFLSSFQNKFLSFWINFLNRSHVRNSFSHVSDDSSHVSKVSARVIYSSAHVGEVSSHVECFLSRVSKCSSHVMDVKRNIILLKSRSVFFLLSLINQ